MKPPKEKIDKACLFPTLSGRGLLLFIAMLDKSVGDVDTTMAFINKSIRSRDSKKALTKAVLVYGLVHSSYAVLNLAGKIRKMHTQNPSNLSFKLSGKIQNYSLHACCHRITLK